MSRETAFVLTCLLLLAVWVLSVLIDESGKDKD